MLNEFDQYLDRRYLCSKARKDRWYNNYSVKIGRRSTKGEARTWKPSVSYCRYADDCVPRALNAASAAGGARCT